MDKHEIETRYRELQLPEEIEAKSREFLEKMDTSKMDYELSEERLSLCRKKYRKMDSVSY